MHSELARARERRWGKKLRTIVAPEVPIGLFAKGSVCRSEKNKALLLIEAWAAEHAEAWRKSRNSHGEWPKYSNGEVFESWYYFSAVLTRFSIA